MKIYKQRPNEGRMTFIICMVFIILFFMLSFSSINNAYGVESEITTSSDIAIDNIGSSIANDLNGNLVLEDDADNLDESILNTSNGTGKSNWTIGTLGPSDSKNINKDKIFSDSSLKNQIKVSNSASPNSEVNIQYADSLNNNYNTNTLNYILDNVEDLKKIGDKYTKLDFIDFYSLYPIQYSESRSNNYADYSNDISDYINNHVVFLLSNSNLKGNGFDNFNNFIKEVATFNLNKVNNEEDTSIIQVFQSGYDPPLNILFFIKIFMEYHDNGKEHLNSF